MFKIKKKTFILLISYLSVAVLVLGGYAFAQNSVGGNYGNTAQDGYRHAFDEVTTAIEDLDETLQKSAYATGNEMTQTLCARAYGDCVAAEMTLSALPFSTQEMEQTAGFLGRVGDYTYSLCRTAPANGGFSEAERQSLSKLAETASQLASQMNKIQSDVAVGNVIMDDPENVVRLKSDEYKNSTTLSSVFLQNESAFPEQDELQYDGRYGYKAAKEAGENCTQGEALKIAADFLNLSEDRFTPGAVSSGDRLSYYFSVSVPDGEGTITVDGQRGLVRSFTDSRIIPEGDISTDTAAADAKKLIEKYGYGDVVLTKAEKTDGAVRCEFVPIAGGAKCYPDLIKISIASDNGGVCAFDASDYIKNHKSRTVPAGLLTDAACRKALLPNLTVQNSALAVIQSAGGNDIFCREYECQNGNGDMVTIFVSALTGRQQDILLK